VGQSGNGYPQAPPAAPPITRVNVGGNVSNGAAPPQPSMLDIYNKFRAVNPTPGADALDRLAEAYSNNGYKVDRPMYNGVQSGNELNINGQKTKFTVGDVGGANTGWYTWGTDDSAPGGKGAGYRTSIPAGSKYTPLSGSQTFDVAGGTAYLNQINHSIGGGDLTQDQLNEAAQIAGYQPGQPLTGDQLNKVVAEMYRRAGKDPNAGAVATNDDTTGNLDGGKAGSLGHGEFFASSGATANPANPAGPGGSDLTNYLLGRGTGKITDDSMPNLQVGADTPIVKSQTDAFRAEATRNSRNFLSRAAEQGGPNANMDAVSRSQSEKVGQSTSQFEAQAMANEIQARRQEIMQTLQLGTQYLTAQQQMALQRELAQLNYQLQTTLQSNDLAERGYEFDVNDQFRNSPLYG
jgi:hypothetical protein